MITVGQKERATQNRVVKLFRDQLGYTYLGNLERRNNCNIKKKLLAQWLQEHRVSEVLINRALKELDNATALGGGRILYDANRAVYELLRYGAKVKEGAGHLNQMVWLINWKEPEKNHFAIAEEVTVIGKNTKRPDIVLYVNGIALGILELKRSTVSIEQGIRQNLDNQKKEFIQHFFTTMQLVMAGNDSQGLRYGTIETQEKYYLTWKERGEESRDNISQLDLHLLQLCNKHRFLELIHDFIVFDNGVKKVPRHNQYFGVKKAQKRVCKEEGGIIWHTQGSGKSLTMVWLAKWIRENVENSRVLIITDRTELDEQIEGVFKGVKEKIIRIKNGTVGKKRYSSGGAALIATLMSGEDWLMCALLQKFKGNEEEKAADNFIKDFQHSRATNLTIPGKIFVFVDECHRSHSNKLHKAMKAILPDAILIGFTGTPLLKVDKQKSIEVFGSYIDTYKYNEAVQDGIVLDLRYEARDIDQYIKSPDKIDRWFNNKTRGLSDMGKVQLKQKWGTMQKVLSSESRLRMIVDDILMDLDSRPRLMDQRGNVMLVCASIYQACICYDLFSKKGLANKCAIITSYKPSDKDLKDQTVEGETEKLRKYNIYRKMLADHFDEPEDNAMNKIEQFEKDVKERFIKEPGKMRLLIVVDKLLTGFDAPSATYLYIDKQMRDHTLFQAICRVNRLDGEDKEYGYIIDYKDLFHKLEGAISDYTNGALDGYEKKDVIGLLTNRLEKARERLEEVHEAVIALCEPVATPKDSPAYLHYFCAEVSGDIDELKENEPKRVTLYRLTAALIRAYANIANEMEEAGYTREESRLIKSGVEHYKKVRDEVKIASRDYVDMKIYEPAMRHLMDTYISADDSEEISTLGDLGLIDLIVEKGLDTLERLPKGIRQKPEAVAETIENNLRRIIVDEHPINPKYYEKMSELLDILIEERRTNALDYQKYLEKIKQLMTQVKKPAGSKGYPKTIDTQAKQSLYENLDNNETLAVNIDHAVRISKKDDWRGNNRKEHEVKNAIRDSFEGELDETLVEKIFQLVKAQHDY